MSCDWDVWCTTCDVGLGLDWSHGEHACLALIEQRDELAHMASLNLLDIDVRVNGSHIDIGWFARHAGHALVPRDEYGRLFGQCGLDFGCPTCKHSERCRRPKGHDGDHAATG